MQMILLGMALALSAPAADPTPTGCAKKTAALGQKGFALWSCAILAGNYGAAGDEKSRDLAERGSSALRTFIDRLRTQTDPTMKKALDQAVPVLILQHLGGPNTDFVLGREWEAISLWVEDDLYNRDTWLHQRWKPTMPSPPYSDIKEAAKGKFAQQNCQVL